MADGVKPADLYPLDLTARHEEARHDQGRPRLLGFGRRVPGADRLRRSGDDAHLERPRLERQAHRQQARRDPVEPADRHRRLLRRPEGHAEQGRGDEVHRLRDLRRNNAKPSEFIPYGPINKNSKPAAANVADLSVSNADENSAYFDDKYLIDNYAQIDAAYQAWKTQ